MINIKLIVAYDGSAYLGWQATKEGPSIEESLQTTLETLLQHPVKLNAASRTDAGVHARGLPVNFHSTKNEIDSGKLIVGLNALLPEDIKVLSAQLMPASFHATLDCIGKEYHYRVSFSPIMLPHDRHTVWHYPYPLDISKMREAAKLLIGKHDFRALCNAKKNEEYSDYIRMIQSIEIIEEPENKLLFKIIGTSFLYKMARNIVGLLVYVGKGNIPLEEVDVILNSQDRTRAGITAPAHGLFLDHVIYP